MRKAVDKARLMFSYRGGGRTPDPDEKGKSKDRFRSRRKKREKVLFVVAEVKLKESEIINKKERPAGDSDEKKEPQEGK